jgi:very-short-patch-repair endonuclease
MVVAPPKKVMLRLARAQRARPSSAEDMIWTVVRGRRIGAKFRRQVSIGPYIADFLCLERCIVVEVDGPTHLEPEQMLKDKRRDEWFALQGFRILRLTSDEVIGDPEIAARRIRETLALPMLKR